MNKEQKDIYDLRRGWVAIKQLREVQRLLDVAGVPEFVYVGGDIGNAPQTRLQWFLMRRKNVAEFEKDKDLELNQADIAAIKQLAVYGRGKDQNAP